MTGRGCVEKENKVNNIFFFFHLLGVVQLSFYGFVGSFLQGSKGRNMFDGSPKRANLKDQG
jgi:hypothetical protein